MGQEYSTGPGRGAAKATIHTTAEHSLLICKSFH